MLGMKLVVIDGARAGERITLTSDLAQLGRNPSCDVIFPDTMVSGVHARLFIGAEAVSLEDLGSTNGSVIVRAGQRLVVEGSPTGRTQLEPGDEIELGGPGTGGVRFQVQLEPEQPEARVLSLRRIEEIPTVSGAALRDTELLLALRTIDQRLQEPEDLLGVLTAVADAALTLTPRASHATLSLSDAPDPRRPPHSPVFLPMVTRTRGASGDMLTPEEPVAMARSVLRRVLKERAAVLAADVTSEGLGSDSLLGASIQSTIGVPLWRGEEILGVLQVDSRGIPATFDTSDLDVLSVLASNASLAVSNARLLQHLSSMERRLQGEVHYLKDRARPGQREARLIGNSAPMVALLEKLEKVVDTRVPVLIEGETGTGKELIAAALHHRSRRHAKLLVAQNCAALPEALLESELFGHRRGAFTGATEDRRGLFELADGGTLFLDEIAELPLSLQAKLLRVLQEGEVRPLGATSTRRVDVRIVTATHRSLAREVAEGRFRQDLYYRLEVFPLQVPPLRERGADIALLASHFLQTYALEFGKPVAGFSQEALAALGAYEWPGNVRELQNEVQRAVIEVEPGGIVHAALLGPKLRRTEELLTRAGVTRGSLREMTEQMERWFLQQALREHAGNKTAAAKALGITREGLHKKLRQLGMS